MHTCSAHCGTDIMCVCIRMHLLVASKTKDQKILTKCIKSKKVTKNAEFSGVCTTSRCPVKWNISLFYILYCIFYILLLKFYILFYILYYIFFIFYISSLFVFIIFIHIETCVSFPVQYQSPYLVIYIFKTIYNQSIPTFSSSTSTSKNTFLAAYGL